MFWFGQGRGPKGSGPCPTLAGQQSVFISTNIGPVLRKNWKNSKKDRVEPVSVYGHL